MAVQDGSSQDGHITVAKLTTIRQLFEGYREDIPEEEMGNYDTETECPEYRVNLLKMKKYID